MFELLFTFSDIQVHSKMHELSVSVGGPCSVDKMISWDELLQLFVSHCTNLVKRDEVGNRGSL